VVFKYRELYVGEASLTFVKRQFTEYHSICQWFDPPRLNDDVLRLRLIWNSTIGALRALCGFRVQYQQSQTMSKFIGSTTCPYCLKIFRKAGPFDKHLRVSHPNHAAKFYSHSSRHEGSNDPEEDFENSLQSEDNNPYEFPCEPSSDESEGDHHDSDAESESESEEAAQEPEERQPTRCERYEGSGKSYGCISGEEERIHNLIRNPWSPFRNASEFKLARFFVEANIPWEQINNFLKASLAPPKVFFTSAYTFRTLLNNMDNGLGPESWNQGEVTFSGTKVPFFFRNPVDCVKYLIRQKAYESDLVYSPERLYEGDERQYGELHTADWWWEKQVSALSK